MDFKVVFKGSFIEDLERIVRWIAADNPDAARNLGNLIIDRCESLSFFPERHPRVRQRPGIRRFIVGRNFKIFYRVIASEDVVEIVHVRHTSRRPWSGEEN